MSKGNLNFHLSAPTVLSSVHPADSGSAVDSELCTSVNSSDTHSDSPLPFQSRTIDQVHYLVTNELVAKDGAAPPSSPLGEQYVAHRSARSGSAHASTTQKAGIRSGTTHQDCNDSTEGDNDSFRAAAEFAGSADEAFELLSAYLDDEVTEEERCLVQHWLASDPEMKSHYQKQLKLRQAMRLFLND